MNKRAPHLVSAQQVLHYLSHHPNFWSQYPDILLKQDVSFANLHRVDIFYRQKARKLEIENRALQQELLHTVTALHQAQTARENWQKVLHSVLALPRSEWASGLCDSLVQAGLADEAFFAAVTAKQYASICQTLADKPSYTGPYLPQYDTWWNNQSVWAPRSCAIFQVARQRVFFLGHRNPRHFETQLASSWLHCVHGFIQQVLRT